MQIEKGLILNKYSLINICKRKKKEIVLPEISNSHIGKPIYVCGDKVQGIIILNQPHTIDDQQFDSHFNRHFVTKGFREKVWPEVSKFYTYSFRIKKIFKKPLDYICDDKKSIRFLDNVELMEKAKWTTAYINTLPNSSFAVIEPAYLRGEVKDKRARHLPFKDKSGKVDLPHYRNALARVNQIKPITDSITTAALRQKAIKKLEEYRHVLNTGKALDKHFDENFDLLKLEFSNKYNNLGKSILTLYFQYLEKIKGEK